jgi:hypothetical protein
MSSTPTPPIHFLPLFFLWCYDPSLGIFKQRLKIASYFKGLSLDGKIALVIGGTSGIGKAIAWGLAEAGADVVAVSRRAEEGRKTAEEIRALGRRTPSLHSPFLRGGHSFRGL